MRSNNSAQGAVGIEPVIAEAGPAPSGVEVDTTEQRVDEETVREAFARYEEAMKKQRRARQSRTSE